jgi:hypothetical protein
VPSVIDGFSNFLDDLVPKTSQQTNFPSLSKSQLQHLHDTWQDKEISLLFVAIVWSLPMELVKRRSHNHTISAAKDLSAATTTSPEVTSSFIRAKLASPHQCACQFTIIWFECYR